MRKASRSALVPYSADQMFTLVEYVEDYPDFLPWCDAVEVHLREGNVIEATLELHRSGVSKTFRTRNTSIPGERMDIVLVSGAFRHLSGGWTFDQLGDAGCKVALALEFKFASPMLDIVFGHFFEETCNSLVDAFVQRANVIYGKSQ